MVIIYYQVIFCFTPAFILEKEYENYENISDFIEHNFVF